jgi:hypothetical protein
VKQDTLKFLPLLIFYVVFVFIASSKSFWGDEGRYVMFASNLSNGFYSPKDDVYLWNGPGYPLILVPFLLLKLPWLTAKLLNALFLFMAVIYFNSTLRIYIQKRVSFYYTYIFGLYPIFMRHMHLLITETFAILLVCGFLYHFCRLCKSDKFSWMQALLASSYLGYLALTKIFFGYVILSGILLSLFLYLLIKRSELKRTILVYLLALLICLPYLSYTYSLTGKVFYWGNSGGQSLYWMSTPYDNEFGDWQYSEKLHKKPEVFKNHQEFLKEISGLTSVQKDDEYKRRAVHNIRKNPAKYFRNWLANIGRLIFNYPYTYSYQKLSTYFYIVPNMFFIVFLVLSLYPGYHARKSIPYEIYGLVLFGVVSFVGSSLLSAYNRQFTILVPVFALWIIYIMIHTVKVEIK